MFTGYNMKTFNRDYVIVDDIFFDTKTLTPGDILGVLIKFGSGLEKMTAGPENKPVYQVIYDLSIKYGLNPAILIARIQTESSAITTKKITKDRLDWILGVGCPNKVTRYEQFRGFEKQLESAAYKLGQEYLYGKKFLNGKPIPKVMTVENHAGDGEKIKIYPGSKAAYILYTYNPEVGYDVRASRATGNYLFYLVFKRFFGKAA